MFPFTLHQLQIFKAIANEKTLTDAAKSLYLSQPSISKQIRILEKNLNIILIHRIQNDILLTESGRVFLQYANRILNLCEESCFAIADLKNGDRGSLRVGASQIIGTYLMPEILTHFAKSYPQITLNIQADSTPVIAKKIIDQKIDIAIVGGEMSDDLKEKLTIKPFINDELSLIISKSHPFAKKKKIDKEDLYCLEFITLNSNFTTKKFIDNILIQNKIKAKRFKTILQLNSIEEIKTAVSLGLGAAFVPSSAIRKEIQLKTIETVKIKKIEINRELSILSNPECLKSKAFEFFDSQLTQLKVSKETKNPLIKKWTCSKIS